MTAIVGCVSEGDEQEYRGAITDFVDWCEDNHLHYNASKTKEMVVDFRRKAPRTARVNIQGLGIEIVGEYKYLGVHLSNKLDTVLISVPLSMVVDYYEHDLVTFLLVIRVCIIT